MAAVSVVLPFRNSADTLAECLESIRNQTLQDYELIAINDGSSDESADIVKRFSESDSRIRLRQPGAIGLVAALNLGVVEARAEYIARMDADDVMGNTRLEEQEHFLRHHSDIALVSCHVQIFPEGYLRNGYREYQRWQNNCVTPEDIADNRYVESPHAHPSVMLRKTVLEQMNGYRQGDFPEDYDLWLRMAEAGFKMAKIPKVLLFWRDRPDRFSRVDPRYARNAFDRLRAVYLSRDERVRSAKELVLWGAGRETRKRARRLLSHGIIHSGWIDIDPRKIGKIIDGRRVYDASWLKREPRPFVLIYVTNHGARDEIEEYLNSIGYRRGDGYLAVG